MKRVDIIIGATSILIGVVVLILSNSMRMFDDNGVPAERLWPFGLACLFIAAGVFQGIEIRWQTHKQAEKQLRLLSPGARCAYAAAVIAIVFSLILDLVGFILASALFIPTLMVLMGERRPWFMSAVTMVTVTSLYSIFTMVFNSPLPTAAFLH